MNTVGGSKGGVPTGYDFVSTVQYEYHNCPPVRAGYELQYVLYYSTQSRRRPSLHQASVKKGGPRGVSPLVRSGGGLKNRRFPPPHPSDDNVLYSIFAPCLVWYWKADDEIAWKLTMSLLTPTKLPYENAFSYGNENRRRNSRPRTDTAGYLSVRKLPGQDLRHVLYI